MAKSGLGRDQIVSQALVDLFCVGLPHRVAAQLAREPHGLVGAVEELVCLDSTDGFVLAARGLEDEGVGGDRDLLGQISEPG